MCIKARGHIEPTGHHLRKLFPDSIPYCIANNDIIIEKAQVYEKCM